MDIQKDLFLYLYPACLCVLQENLASNNSKISYGGEQCFWTVFSYKNVFSDILSESQLSVLMNCLEDIVYNQIGKGKELSVSVRTYNCYEWCVAIVSLGNIYPVIGDLFSRWWKLESYEYACFFCSICV